MHTFNYENQLPNTDTTEADCKCCGYEAELNEGFCNDCHELPTCHECNNPANGYDCDEDTGTVVDCCNDCKVLTDDEVKDLIDRLGGME